jgi:hypothetical protein
MQIKMPPPLAARCAREGEMAQEPDAGIDLDVGADASRTVGDLALRKEALNWTPCVRSLIQDPLAWTNSPAEIIAAWPTRVMRSR